MKLFRRLRGQLYWIVRRMGDLSPWLDLDLRKVIRRQIHKQIGTRAGKFAFGGGGLGRFIKGMLGL